MPIKTFFPVVQPAAGINPAQKVYIFNCSKLFFMYPVAFVFFTIGRSVQKIAEHKNGEMNPLAFDKIA